MRISYLDWLAKSSVMGQLVCSVLVFLHLKPKRQDGSDLGGVHFETVRVYEVNDETPPSDDDRRGMVDDISIEARMPTTPAGVGAGVYLTNWEGYSDLDCSWVRESAMSMDTKDWWLSERELRYPGYSSGTFRSMMLR